MFDAHSHFSSSEALVCSDYLQVPQKPYFRHAIGLLPQYADSVSIDELKRLLLENPEALIGEVGLDRRFKSNISMTLQVENLRKIFTSAVELKRAVVLHCVRADGLMLDLLKEFKTLKAIWHGFNGSLETANQLKKLGVMISIRPGFGSGVLEFALNNPRNFSLESDFSGEDKMEYDKVLSSHYENITERGGVPCHQKDFCDFLA